MACISNKRKLYIKKISIDIHCTLTSTLCSSQVDCSDEYFGVNLSCLFSSGNHLWPLIVPPSGNHLRPLRLCALAECAILFIAIQTPPPPPHGF